jgi:DNA-binding CsgD family transcriptional regulator
MITRNYPAGLLDNNIEFFLNDEAQPHYLQSGMVVPFERFPDHIIELLEKKLLSDPKRHERIRRMVGSAGRMAEIKQLAGCLYGGLDKHPDIVDGQLIDSEYWNCPRRAQCKHNGKVCSPLLTETGKSLTERQVDVLKLIAEGQYDKEIADTLQISEHTVTTHTKNIRIKTGLDRKPELVGFAYQVNLMG